MPSHKIIIDTDPGQDDAIAILLALASEEIDLLGCTDETACNYNPGATVDDGSCEYAEENYDCDGNCIVEVDCLGACGGSAYVDECGECDDDPTNDGAEEGFYFFRISTFYNVPVITVDGEEAVQQLFRLCRNLGSYLVSRL